MTAGAHWMVKSINTDREGGGVGGEAGGVRPRVIFKSCWLRF